MPNNQTQNNNPTLAIKEIVDIYIRKNFENLRQYFNNENQLYGFKFHELIFTQAQTDFKFPHGLTYIPEDVVVTKVVGGAEVIFNNGVFTNTHGSVTVSGPCRVRFFIGSYWNQIPGQQKSITDKSYYGLPVSSAPPTGSIMAYGGATAPTGWLMCDGQSYSRTDYAALFAVIGVSFGSSNPGTFTVPDLRGRFLRGTNNGSGNDPDASTRIAQALDGATGDAVGSYQEDQYKSHTHTYQFYHPTSLGGGNRQTGLTGNPPYNYSDPNANLPSGGNETRPKNVNVNFIIKT